MAFVRNRPTASELLTVSQPMLRDNFNSSDDAFGIDHYKFSNTTANIGFHNTVTQPIIAIVPPSMVSVHPTTSTNAIIYAMQDSPNIGVIQYSKGPVFNGYQPSPTPLTRLHSSSSPIVLNAGTPTTNILDFVGLNNAMCRLYASNYGSSTASTTLLTVDVLYNLIGGVTPFFRFISNISSNGSLTQFFPTSTGSILQLKVSGIVLNNIFWSLEFIRINQ